MKKSSKAWLISLAALGATMAAPDPAAACGGFFCAQTQPVNQAAERIVFADNGDGTVTAVIQIMYEGPSESFSWLLPISSVPATEDIQVASDLAFQRLQAATNPQYNLTVRVEGTCKGEGRGVPASDSGSATGGSGGSSAGGAGGGGGVTIEASGMVGAFEWTVISLDASLAEPAEVATTWLTANGYDVPPGAAGLIGPYLEDGLYLLALRLRKGSDVGSIRPIVLTYEASRPMIPVKLTAVAANEDMGVMTWVLGSARAVPQNYLSLELNEARINWFNASSNYNDVVIAAANEGDGRGFVTEFAGPATSLANVVWTQFDDSRWQSFRSGVYSTFQEIFDNSFYTYGQWDGYWDAVGKAVTLPADVAFEDFKLCPSCYSTRIQFYPSEFMAALESDVIEPVRRVQDLIDSHAQVTRLYTTLSAEEMIVDPLFTFNPDLPGVSNIHSAERVIECNPDVYQWEAPWRIELPQGGVIRGEGQPTQTWPEALSEQPSNLMISRLGETGDGQVLEDNSGVIQTQLNEYNRAFPKGSESDSDSGGCAVRPSSRHDAAFWTLFGLTALALRTLRRRRST